MLIVPVVLNSDTSSTSITVASAMVANCASSGLRTGSCIVGRSGTTFDQASRRLLRMNWPIVFSSASSISVISAVRAAGEPVPPSNRSINTRATGQVQLDDGLARQRRQPDDVDDGRGGQGLDVLVVGALLQHRQAYLDAGAEVRGERRAEHPGERLVQDPQRPQVLFGELVRSAEVVQLGRTVLGRQHLARPLRGQGTISDESEAMSSSSAAEIVVAAEQRLTREESLDLCL